MTAKQTKPPTFVGAPSPSLATDLLDKLVAFEPRGEEIIETKLGESQAVIARVLEIHEDGGFTDYGEHPIFWVYVRRQLLAGGDEAQWVVGRLVKAGQAFRLESPSETESMAIGKVLAKAHAA